MTLNNVEQSLLNTGRNRLIQLLDFCYVLPLSKSIFKSCYYHARRWADIRAHL